MSIELMLLAVNLNFLLFSVYLDDLIGQLFALFVLTVAAAESAIGLALLVIYYRVRGTIAVEFINLIKVQSVISLFSLPCLLKLCFVSCIPYPMLLKSKILTSLFCFVKKLPLKRLRDNSCAYKNQLFFPFSFEALFFVFLVERFYSFFNLFFKPKKQ